MSTCAVLSSMIECCENQTPQPTVPSERSFAIATERTPTQPCDGVYNSDALSTCALVPGAAPKHCDIGTNSRVYRAGAHHASMDPRLTMVNTKTSHKHTHTRFLCGPSESTTVRAQREHNCAQPLYIRAGPNKKEDRSLCTTLKRICARACTAVSENICDEGALRALDDDVDDARLNDEHTTARTCRCVYVCVCVVYRTDQCAMITRRMRACVAASMFCENEIAHAAVHVGCFVHSSASIDSYLTSCSCVFVHAPNV